MTPAPLDDRRYWWRLLAVAHPDRNGGDGDLFVFLTALREHVEGCCAGSFPNLERFAHANARANATGTGEAPERVPFDPILSNADEFVRLTGRALEISGEVGEPFAAVLLLLVDLPAHDHGRAVPRQSRGASYRQLARITHTLGWSKEQRVRWYRIAESVPLSCAHASHIILGLQKSGRRAA